MADSKPRGQGEGQGANLDRTKSTFSPEGVSLHKSRTDVANQMKHDGGRRHGENEAPVKAEE